MGQPVYKSEQVPINAILVPARKLMARLDFVVMLVIYIKEQAGQDVSNLPELIELASVYRRDKAGPLRDAIEGVVARTMLKFGEGQAYGLLEKCNLQWFRANYPSDLRIEYDDIYFWD